MFDTMDVARRIRQARNQKNMTQMALADAMGVSFQAVSNWERGNSLPDIGKLPDLCRILDVPIQELLGDNAEADTVVRLVEKVEVEPERLAEVAPMVSPEHIASACRNARGKGKAFSLKAIAALAPFLDEEYLDELAEQAVVEAPEELGCIAPFLSEVTLERLVRQLDGVDDTTLISLAPFVSDATLEELAAGCSISDLSKLFALAPFLREETVDREARRLTKNEACSPEQILGLAPFLSGRALRDLVERTMRKGDQDGFSSL